MSGGYTVGGGGASSTSAAYLSLPYKGYRELPGWFEEFVNAFGSELDILDARFISASARANLLDPTYTPTEPTDPNLATTTAAPTSASVQDSMLDILAYIALATYPLNQNFTTAEKQAMVAVGWDAIKRKGTRQALLELAAAACKVVTGWTVPPFNFSLILPDGLPSPGWGSTWSPVTTAQAGTVSTTAASNAITGAGTAFTTAWHGYRVAIVNGATVQTDWVANVSSATALTTVNNLTDNTAGSTFYISTGASFRPWIFEALRKIVGRFMVDWSEFGICYSQFRAGYSAAGETVLPSGAKLGRVTNPHFDTWSAGVPTSWTKGGTGTLTQSPSVAQINYEFTSSSAQIDLTGAAAGVGVELSQNSIAVNNQLDYRVEVDYAYTNTQLVDTLTLQILDLNNSQYWNGTGWQSTLYLIPLPVSSGAATRVRHVEAITLQANSTTATTLATQAIYVALAATSDGTATTQGVYTLYRCDVLPVHDVEIEAEAGGERTLWLPLKSTWNISAVGSGFPTCFSMANHDRSAYKVTTSTVLDYSYHAALSGRGLRCRSNWTNQIKGSNVFTTDWTLTNATKTDNAEISPIIGESSATAPRLTATSTGASIAQTVGAAPIDPSENSYVGGVWVKKLSADNVFTDVTISLVSTSTKSEAYTLTQAQGWTLLPIRHTFAVTDIANLEFKIAWGAASASGQIAVAGSYLYDVTGRAGVLYPPVCVTSAGLTGSTAARASKVVTASQDANVLDRDTQRSMVSVTRGVAAFDVVPTYDAGSQPNSVIFDFGESTTANRVVVDISSNTIRARIIDDTPTTSSCSLTLTTNADPTSSQATWNRDTKIPIRLRWQDNGKISMSVGSSSVASSTPGSWAPAETAVALIRVGCDIADANPFDGMISDLDVLQVGAPVT